MTFREPVSLAKLGIWAILLLGKSLKKELRARRASSPRPGVGSLEWVLKMYGEQPNNIRIPFLFGVQDGLVQADDVGMPV